jgi:DNA-binding response OmpR family regulator
MLKHSVLIVDDDPLILDTLAKRLATREIEVQAARTPAQAKELLAKFKPELILLDLLLTNDDGAQGILDFMKSDPFLKSIPVLALTNLDKPELKQVMLAQGVKEYLIKGSLSLDEIYAKVLSYLEPAVS